MPRKQTEKKTRGARQVARPGICYELPIVIEEDEVAPPSDTTASKPRVMFEDILLGTHAPKVHGAPRRDGKTQGFRKRARQYVDGDEANAGDGAKRPRLSGELRLQDGGGLNHCTIGSARESDHQGYRPSHNKNKKSFQPSLGNLEMNLLAMQRDNDRQRTVAMKIEVAEEQSKLQEEAEIFREAELRERQCQSNFESNIIAMRRDWDHQRDAAERLRRDREREQQMEIRMKDQEKENERLREISSLENHLRKLWESHDLAQGRAVRPGQLSERGRRRVQEREELRRRGIAKS